MIEKHAWVGRSKMKRDTYLLNLRLSLCTRMKIKVMNESPSELQCALFVLPLIWPHVLSGCIFRRSKNSSMRTFSADFAMESLMGVHPDGAERCPPLFNAIAMRDVSLVRWMCKIVLKSVLESLQTCVCQGIASSSDWTKPLTGAQYGTKVRGRMAEWTSKYCFPWSRRGQGFLFVFFGWKGQTPTFIPKELLRLAD